MKMLNYITNFLKSKKSLYLLIILLIIRFIVIPEVHNNMTSVYCEKIIKLKYLDNVIDILSGYLGFFPLMLFNIIIFTLAVIVIVIKKKTGVSPDVFLIIILFSLIPELFIFNSPGVFAFYHKSICESDMHMLVGSRHFIFNVLMNLIIMISVTILYLNSYFRNKDSWKAGNIVFLEMELCLVLSIIFPVTFDFFH